jgi:hypothetical protein
MTLTRPELFALGYYLGVMSVAALAVACDACGWSFR